MVRLVAHFNMETGMNKFLKNLGITFRRDEETKRPRVNNLGSRLDREQKENGNYYYSASNLRIFLKTSTKKKLFFSPFSTEYSRIPSIFSI